jgi:hypothetical protein
MNYRVNGDFKLPFRIFTIVEGANSTTLEVSVKVRSDIPETHFGNNVSIRFPIPKSTTSASTTLPPGVTGQTAEVKVPDIIIKLISSIYHIL